MDKEYDPNFLAILGIITMFSISIGVMSLLGVFSTAKGSAYSNAAELEADGIYCVQRLNAVTCADNKISLSN